MFIWNLRAICPLLSEVPVRVYQHAALDAGRTIAKLYWPLEHLLCSLMMSTYCSPHSTSWIDPVACSQSSACSHRTKQTINMRPSNKPHHNPPLYTLSMFQHSYGGSFVSPLTGPPLQTCSMLIFRMSILHIYLPPSQSSMHAFLLQIYS